MEKEYLEKMLKEAKAKLQAVFAKAIESASDEEVKEYENRLKMVHDLEEQLALAEKAELDERGNENVPKDNTDKKPLTEKQKFGLKIVEAIELGTKFNGKLPREVAQEIQKKKEDLARIRGLCSVHSANGDYTVYVSAQGAVVEYVTGGTNGKGEGQTIPETTPSIDAIALSALKLGALIKVSREYLVDLGVDVMNYVINELAKGFARKEDTEIIFGTGTTGDSGTKTKLRGIVTNATANTVTAASGTEFTWEEVKSFIQSIKAYRTNATLVCGRAFLDMCHNFKSGDTYLFPQQNEITSILGVPVVVSDVFGALTADTACAVVGDFSYYHILDRESMEIVTLNELYAATDQIGIRGIERVDGDLVPEAFAVFKMGAAA